MIVFIIVLLIIIIGILTYFIEDKELILPIYSIWLIVSFLFLIRSNDSYKDKIEQGLYKIDSVGYRYDSQTKDTIILYKLNNK